MARFFRAFGRAFLTVLRAVLLLMLVVIPIPVGELFHKLTDPKRRNEAAKVVKKENPD